MYVSEFSIACIRSVSSWYRPSDGSRSRGLVSMCGPQSWRNPWYYIPIYFIRKYESIENVDCGLLGDCMCWRIPFYALNDSDCLLPSVRKKSTDIIDASEDFYPSLLLWGDDRSIHPSLWSFLLFHFDEKERSSLEDNHEVWYSRGDSHAFFLRSDDHGDLWRESWLIGYMCEYIPMQDEPSCEGFWVLCFGHGLNILIFRVWFCSGLGSWSRRVTQHDSFWASEVWLPRYFLWGQVASLLFSPRQTSIFFELEHPFKVSKWYRIHFLRLVA